MITKNQVKGKTFEELQDLLFSHDAEWMIRGVPWKERIHMLSEASVEWAKAQVEAMEEARETEAA